MSRILTNEKPKTTFMDEEGSIEVELISWPNIEQTKKMIVDVCYGYNKTDIYDTLTKSEKADAIQEVIKGGSLPKALEMTGKFVFLIKNIPLTVTHCLVRHRFFTILQSSTAVNCLRNANFVMPQSFRKSNKFYDKVKEWYLKGKELYCEGVDKHGLSVQNCRLLIPKNNCNHMYIGCDLLSLKAAYGQRMDTCEEPIQHNIIFKKMERLVLQKFPYLKGIFVSNCVKGSCLHCRTGEHANIVFKRDEQHRKFLPDDYDPDKQDNLLHDRTRDAMNKGYQIVKENYIGDKKA